MQVYVPLQRGLSFYHSKLSSIACQMGPAMLPNADKPRPSWRWRGVAHQLGTYPPRWQSWQGASHPAQHPPHHDKPGGNLPKVTPKTANSEGCSLLGLRACPAQQEKTTNCMMYKCVCLHGKGFRFAYVVLTSLPNALATQSIFRKYKLQQINNIRSDSYGFCPQKSAPEAMHGSSQDSSEEHVAFSFNTLVGLLSPSDFSLEAILVPKRFTFPSPAAEVLNPGIGKGAGSTWQLARTGHAISPLLDFDGWVNCLPFFPTGSIMRHKQLVAF